MTIVKFKCEDPLLAQKIELLKLQFRTGAASKAVKKAIENYYEIERKVELLQAQNDSMQSEINRLREIIELNKSNSVSNKIAHIRSLRS